MTQDDFALKAVDALLQDSVGRVFTGATLLIFHKGHVRFRRVYGSLHPEQTAPPVSLTTRFDLASLTKLFTATGFMLLAQAGKVTTDTPVCDVLPEFGPTRRLSSTQDPFTYKLLPPLAGRQGEEFDVRGVTFQHLLTHSSGLAPWRSLFREGPYDDPVPLPHLVTPAVRTRRIAALYEQYGLAYPPGARIAYSDLGFILLGEAITRLSGRPLNVFIQQSLLDPLGMTHTCFNPLAHAVPQKDIAPTGVCSWRQRRCWGEVHDQNAAGLGGVAGHAGLFSTADDLLTFARLFLDAEDRPEMLTSAIIAEMTREQARWQGLRRGLGWQLPGDDGAPVGTGLSRASFGHTGFTGTSLWIDPTRKLIIILLTNRVYYGTDAGAIAGLRIRLHNAIAEATL